MLARGRLDQLGYALVATMSPIFRHAVALFPILTAIPLFGCALPTREAFEARMAAFVGRPEGELVMALGVPARTYEADGRRFLQYESRRAVPYLYPAYPAYPGFGWHRFGGFGYGPSAYPVYETRACDVTFVLRAGRVEGFTDRGDDCRAVG
jgi:hypothetical protein